MHISHVVYGREERVISLILITRHKFIYWRRAKKILRCGIYAKAILMVYDFIMYTVSRFFFILSSEFICVLAYFTVQFRGWCLLSIYCDPNDSDLNFTRCRCRRDSRKICTKIINIIHHQEMWEGKGLREGIESTSLGSFSNKF